MGYSVDAYIFYGIQLTVEELDVIHSMDCPALVDGLEEWLYNANIECITPGHYDCKDSLIIGKNIMMASWEAEEIPDVDLTFSEKMHYYRLFKALFRYLDIPERRCAWYLVPVYQ